MIPLDTALDQLMALFAPLGHESIPLGAATDRYLAQPLIATHNQPPFDASAMDGFAIRSEDLETHKPLRIIGESAAGHPFAGHLNSGKAVRISTGAIVPSGADKILIKEDAQDLEDYVTPKGQIDDAQHIRRAGQDFKKGFTIEADQKISSDMIGLIAAMNIVKIVVYRRPKIAIISTGDELIPPGTPLQAGQIIASNAPLLESLARSWGGEVTTIPIAKDTTESITSAINAAKEADLIVTTGGASVGAHDLVGPVAKELGYDLAFHKIAMRPGKPVMAGKRENSVLLGLPGNPVSAAVCARLFMRPAIEAMQGQIFKGLHFQRAKLEGDIPANGPRAHFMRATLFEGIIKASMRQDSALLSVLAGSNALIHRVPHATEAQSGDWVDFLPL